MNEAVDACREVHAVLKTWLVTRTTRRLTDKKHQLELADVPGDSQHLVHATQNASISQAAI